MRAALGIVLLALCAETWSATDDAAAEARALHAEAARARDIWTCLQLEAWAARHGGPRLRPLLAEGVYGEPLLGFADPVLGYWDRGRRDGIAVATGARFFRLAHDGRPLAMPLPLPFAADRTALSGDGRWLLLARVDVRHRESESVLRVAIVDTRERRTVLEREVVARWEPKGSSYRLPDSWDPVVAEDGSAAALGLYGRSQIDQVAVITAAESTLLPACSRPAAVGPRARWLIVRASGRWALDRAGAERRRIDGSFAAGGGAAVFLDDDKALLVRPDGKLVRWPVPAVPERLLSVGRWLAVDFGEVDPATLDVGDQPLVLARPAEDAPGAEDAVDLLGGTAEPEAEDDESIDLLAPAAGPAPAATPATVPDGVIACFRWEALAADAKAPAALLHRFPLAQDRASAAALLGWSGRTLRALDLDADAPAQRDVLEAPEEILAAASGHHHYVLQHPRGWSVVRGDGTVLAAGDGAAEVQVPARRAACIVERRGRNLVAATVVRLDPDPSQRRSVRVEAPFPERWDVTVDEVDGSILLEEDDAWIHFAADGTELARFVPQPEQQDRSPPSQRNHDDPVGAFFLRGSARLCRKAEEAAPPTPGWTLADAYRSGKTVLLLGDDGTVYAQPTGRTGDAVALGTVSGAASFAEHSGDKGLYLATRDWRIVAALGRTLDERVARNGWTGSAPSNTSWQIRRGRGPTTFTVPGNARPLAWQPETIGFSAKALHGIDRESLLVVTETVALDLPARAASALLAD